MQINSIQTYNLDNKHKQYNKVSFEGLNIKTIFNNSAKQARKQKQINYLCSRIGEMLGINLSEIYSLTKGADEKRMTFFKTLADNYNARNFMLEGKLKEETTPLIETYKLIEAPHREHFSIVNKTKAPFETILELFKNARDKASLVFVQRMQHDVLDDSKKSADLIINMLNSKNRNEFINNTQNYSSYLKLNSDKEDAVKTLDELIAGNEYDYHEYDAKYAIASLYKSKYVQTLFPDKFEYFEKNYTKEGMKFLKSFIHDYLPYNKEVSPEEINDILSMYKTAKPENISCRIDIIDRLALRAKETNTSEIRSIKKLFQKIDEDKNSMSFVYKFLGDGVKVDSAKTLNDILRIVPSKKAKIFHKNIARIVKYTDEEERIAALKNEVENPFFITKQYADRIKTSIKYGFARKESRVSKLAKFMENEINKIRYSRIRDTQDLNISETIPAATRETTQSNQTLQISAITPSEPVKIIPIETESPEIPKIELQRTFKESPQARKLRVQNDVNEIIKQKLGQKTLEKQKEEYTNGAMVMRLKLLPEIFDSIKDTRKLQKMSGKRPNVEAKDAIKLYSKINGKNRKLVNYMLKQTNEKGERIFNIKEIINELTKIETEIAEAKKRNPHFKSTEVKEIYNDEYIYVQYKYGKLKRRKKKIA